MVTSREQQQALAPSLTGAATDPPARSLSDTPLSLQAPAWRCVAQVAQRLAPPARGHESLITSHESRVQTPSTQPGTPRWTHPPVSHWKHLPRVESARNFIPAPSTVPRTELVASKAEPAPLGFAFTNHKSPVTNHGDICLTSVSHRVQSRFVCSPSCRPGKYQLFDNQMNQARTRLVCP
jgi:hypothetical protein